jgi:uncharacterized membrane protein
MQRSIFLGLVASVVFLVVAAGAYWWMKQNRPDQQWVPMPLNPSSTQVDRQQLQQQIQNHLGKEELLRKLVAELSLASRWGVSSDQEALDRLKSSMFIRLGEIRHPMTQELMPSIDIGVKGKRKEHTLLGEIATRLAQEIRDDLAAAAHR